MRFEYVALLANGERDEGVVDAPTREAALKQLHQDNKTPLSVKQSTDGKLLALLTGVSSATYKSPGSDKLGQFLRDLGILLQAGAPIFNALKMIRDTNPDRRILDVVKAMLLELENGATIADAVPDSADPDIRLVAGLIAAGEASGHLTETLELGADLFEARSERQKKILSALAYPIFVMLLGLTSFAIMAFVVAPALSPLLSDSDAGGLKAIISFSEFVSQNWTLVVLVIGGAVLALISALSREFFKLKFSKILSTLPLIGNVTRQLGYGMALQCMGTLLKGGAPVRDALKLAADAVTSPFIRSELTKGLAEIDDGAPLSRVLGSMFKAPVEIGQMVKVGEVSGALGLTLSHTGSMLTSRATRTLMAGISIIGPVMIITFGITSGLLMLTVMSAMTNIGSGVLN